jgi:hypothetical protein
MDQLCQDILNSAREFKYAFVVSAWGGRLIDKAIAYLTQQKEEFTYERTSPTWWRDEFSLTWGEAKITFTRDAYSEREINPEIMYIDHYFFWNMYEKQMDELVTPLLASGCKFFIIPFTSREEDFVSLIPWPPLLKSASKD